MADVITDEPELSSSLSFSEDELQGLESDFKAAPEEEEEDDSEDEDEEGEAEEDEEEEEGDVEDEGEEEDEDEGEEQEGDSENAKKKPDGESAAKKAGEEEKTEGYELNVDGQTVLVDTEEELAAWAQKGIHYERNRLVNEKKINDATYTMNALINDPMASLEEIWTAKFGGNHEQARQKVAKMCEFYLEPIWRELTAEPAQRLKMQEERFTKRQQQTTAQAQQAQDGQFSQEDIQFIQNIDVQIETALESEGLPKESIPLRKWMADVMREGLDRGIQPDPRAAAAYIKSQQKERDEALGNSAPVKDRGKKKVSKKAAKIARAKARRSQRQGGGKAAPPGKRRREPQYLTTREWIDGLNKDLKLEAF
jgi:hypothetical protein